MKRSKPRMPVKLRAQAATAIERHQSRPITPEVAVTGSDAGAWSVASPYSASDELAWCALLFEGFGTRQRGVADVFVHHLARLCSASWDGASWRPNEAELQTAIAMVRSMAPKNEAQAALAAQAVALHFTMMKVAGNLATRSGDARTVAALAAVGRAYAQQLETMQRLQGKRTTRQRITVKNERHIHTHQHIHAGRGGEENGGQPREAIRSGTSSDGTSAALLGKDSAGNVLPMRSGSRENSLSQARRG